MAAPTSPIVAADRELHEAECTNPLKNVNRHDIPRAQPLALPPLVLAKQHAAQLGELLGRVVRWTGSLHGRAR